MKKSVISMALRAAASLTASAALAFSAAADINPEISGKQPVQQNGQLQGQRNWIRKTLAEGGGQRGFSGRDPGQCEFSSGRYGNRHRIFQRQSGSL